jgi:hypothetical protein
MSPNAKIHLKSLHHLLGKSDMVACHRSDSDTCHWTRLSADLDLCEANTSGVAPIDGYHVSILSDQLPS